MKSLSILAPLSTQQLITLLISHVATPLLLRLSMQNLHNQIWTSRMSISTKLKLYNTCILPIFLYGSKEEPVGAVKFNQSDRSDSAHSMDRTDAVFTHTITMLLAIFKQYLTSAAYSSYLRLILFRLCCGLRTPWTSILAGR